MSIPESERLRQRAEELFGDAGRSWHAGLEAQVAAKCREWRLTPGQPFSRGNTCSWVAPVQCAGGVKAVLKINYPERDSLFEGAVLRAHAGRGAARLLRASDDGLCLLIERCRPGTDLWELGTEEGDEIAAGLLRRLWIEPPPNVPFESTADLVKEWRQVSARSALAAGYGADLVAAAVRLMRSLEQSTTRTVLLHGDFHPGNVLASQREPWLAIDPKPLVGDAAYDLAQWLGNRCANARETPDPAAALRKEIHQLSTNLDLDPARVSVWAFVKSLGWDWGPEDARLLYDAVRADSV